MSDRKCPRCKYTGPDFKYVPHGTSADGKYTEQDYYDCPSCGAHSTALDKRRPRLR